MKNNIKLLLLILLSLILNIIWEFAHSSLYIDMSGIPPVQHLLLASFTDAFILLVIFALISLMHKSVKWISLPSKLDYLIIFALTISTALIIEIINLNLGRWTYTSAMPTVFGVGISPLFQLATTGILSLLITRIFNNQTKTLNKVTKYQRIKLIMLNFFILLLISSNVSFGPIIEI